MPDDLRIKYDSSVRLRAAELFAAGYGYRATATQLGIDPYAVRGWRRTYIASGVGGLSVMGKTSRSYPWEVRVAAARAVVEGGEMKADVMARFGIVSTSPLEKWCKAYREGGPEALRPKPKGRPRRSDSAPPKLTREQELEQRIRKLEAENAYLKKSIALKAEKRSRTARKRSS